MIAIGARMNIASARRRWLALVAAGSVLFASLLAVAHHHDDTAASAGHFCGVCVAGHSLHCAVPSLAPPPPAADAIPPTFVAIRGRHFTLPTTYRARAPPI